MNTKAILTNAISELLQETSFDKLTVQMILERSGVSRATFYRYFRDKYNVMNFYYQSHVDTLISKEDGTNWHIILTEICNFIYKNQAYFSKVVKVEGANSFREFLHQYSFNFYEREYLKRKGIKSLSVEEQICMEFYSKGGEFTFENWVRRGFQEPPEVISGIIIKLMPEFMRPYY